MLKSAICLYLATQFLLADSASISISELFKPCRRSDPKLKQCVLEGMNRAVSLANNEVPGYNIPWFNPYRIPIVQANATLENFGSGSATLKNIRLTNAFRVKIDDVKYDLEKVTVEANLTHPRFGIELEYLLDADILGNPVHSEGFFKGKFVLAKSNSKFAFKNVEKKGVKYFDVVDYKLRVTVEDASIYLISKNPEEQVVANFLQNMFNENAHLFLELLNPIYVEQIEKQIHSLLKVTIPFIPADRIIVD